MKTAKCSLSRVTNHIQQISAQFDPDVLQLPGGTLIAIFLLMRSTVIAARDMRVHPGV